MSIVTIDKGWSWAVPVGGFIANFIVGGLAKSYGIILKSTQELLDTDAAPLTLAGGLIYAFMYCFSLVGIFLSQKIGCRIVVNIGALGCVISFFVAFFSTNVVMWVVCIGVGVGFSLAFIYSLIFVMIGRCFRDRVGVAMGISVAGVSVGQMAFPHIITHVINKYGARGTLIIGGGIASHFFLTAALMPRYIVGEESGLKLKKNTKIHSSKKSLADSIEKIPLKEIENGNIENEAVNEGENDVKAQKESSIQRIHVVMLILFIIAKIFGDVGDIGEAFALPLFGESALKLRNEEISMAITVAGIVDLVARVFVGLVSDQSWCRHSLLLTFAWLLEAFNTLFFIWFPNRTTFFICYGIFGLTSGTAITLMTVVLTDLVGQKNLPLGFAMMMLILGLFISPGQFLVGYLSDITGDYTWSMRFLAINLFLGCFFMALEYPVKRIFFGTTAATDALMNETRKTGELPCYDSKEENEQLPGMPQIAPHKVAHKDPRSRMSSISTLSNIDMREILTTLHNEVHS